jgi:aldehyde dehydrogenase (NAD+)
VACIILISPMPAAKKSKPLTAPEAISPAPIETAAPILRAAFDAQAPVALQWRESTAAQRIDRIKQLRRAMLAQRDALYEAFATDMHKCKAEVEGAEIMPVLDEMRHAIGQLKRWMKPHAIAATFTSVGSKAQVQYQPRGRVLIIAPWNYPLNLCFGPLVSAIAAGNTVILKPSELTPHVSALMGQIIAQVFDTSEVAYFEGATATAQALLDLPFDHIFFTGSPAVGKQVMAAASRHLTSITLELGGKSPTIVDETADIALAAENLIWGKFINGGQTCIAPDHIYVHASVKTKFIKACQAALTKFYGSPTKRLHNADLTHIVNARHTQRLAHLLDDAQARGAQVLVGGQVDLESRTIVPTLLDQVSSDMRIMQEEIFGPLLPILEYTDIDAVLASINAQPKPLALYIYSKDQAAIDRLIAKTSSGGVCVNQCMMHFAHGNLPFGGVNNSGIGNAHGYHGFKAFSHERAVLSSGRLRLEKLFAPPYTARRFKLIRQVVDSMRLPSL